MSDANISGHGVRSGAKQVCVPVGRSYVVKSTIAASVGPSSAALSIDATTHYVG